MIFWWLGALCWVDLGCPWWFLEVKDWSLAFYNIGHGIGGRETAALYGLMHGLCLVASVPFLLELERGKDPVTRSQKIQCYSKAAIMLPALALMGITFETWIVSLKDGWIMYSLAAFLEALIVTSPLWLWLKWPEPS